MGLCMGHLAKFLYIWAFMKPMYRRGFAMEALLWWFLKDSKSLDFFLVSSCSTRVFTFHSVGPYKDFITRSF